MAEDAVLTRPPPHLEGYLYKQDPPQSLRIGRQGWKHRYFVVIKDRIQYYTSKDQFDKQNDPKGVIMLPKVNEVYETTFQRVPKQKHINTGFCIATNERAYNLVAETPEDMRQWVRDLLYVKLYWSKQEVARNTVIDEQKFAQMAMLDEQMEDDTIESTYCLYDDDDSDSSPSLPRSRSRGSIPAGSGNVPLKVSLCGGKNVVVTLASKSGTAQDLIDKLSTKLTSSACNVWQVDKEGHMRVLLKSENIVSLRLATHTFFVAELSYRVLVVYFKDNKFEPVLVPYNITAQKVVSLDVVKVQLDVLGVGNAGLFLHKEGEEDQLFSPDDQPCDMFYGKDGQNQLYVKAGGGYLVVKNKALGADKRVRRDTFSVRDNVVGVMRNAAAEKKKLEKLGRVQSERSLLIQQVEEKRKQQAEKEQDRLRREASLQEESKRWQRASEPMMIVDEYYDRPQEPPDVAPTVDDRASNSQHQRKSSTKRHQEKSSRSHSFAAELRTKVSLQEADQPKGGEVRETEKPVDVLQGQKGDVDSGQAGTGVEEREGVESGDVKEDAVEVDKETKGPTLDEVDKPAEASSSSLLDSASKEGRRTSSSASRENAAMPEQEALMLAASAVTKRRSDGSLESRKSRGVSAVESSAVELTDVEREKTKRKTDSDESDMGFVLVPSRRDGYGGRRGRERTPEQEKAAAEMARRSVRRYKSPSPVESGSAQAAAMLASGLAVQTTESDLLLPVRRTQLGKDERVKRGTEKGTSGGKREAMKKADTSRDSVEIPESRSDFFGAKPIASISALDRSHSFSNSSLDGRGSWKDQMDEEERLNSLFDRPHQVMSFPEDKIDDLDKKARDIEKKQVKAPKIPRKPTDVDIARLLAKQNYDVTDGPADTENPAIMPSNMQREERAFEVKSPAVLRIVLKQSTHVDGSSASTLNKRMDFISLSGTLLRNHNGVWKLEAGSAFHTPVPESDNCEVLTVPPHIRATFSHRSKQWNVKSTQWSPIHQPTGSLSGPLIQQMHPLRDQKTVALSTETQSTTNGFLRQFGQPRVETIVVDLAQKRVIAQAVEHAVDMIIQHFSGTRDPQEKEILGDDSRTESVGTLIRGPFCSAMASVFADGMKLFRMGGLVKNSLWHVVQASVTKSGNNTIATAVRVVDDLKKHPYMTDDNVRYRTFICAALNHGFLENWLIQLTTKADFLQKYYEPYSLLRLSSGPAAAIYNELLISVQPLSALPFRLYSAFEARQRQRQQEQTQIIRQVKDDEKQGSGVSSSLPIVGFSSVEAQNETDGSGSSSRSALVESLTDIQQKHMVEVDGPPAEMTVEDQGPAKSGKLWKAVVAVTSSVSQATVGAKQSIQSYWSKLKTSMAQTSDAGEVRALYDNVTDEPDELQFTCGDILVVEEQINDDWLICRLGDQKGMVPANYVELV